LGRLEQPFDRQADLTHVTGSALITGPQGVVLHLHKRLGLWLQPGGHLEAGETPWGAARREATEETGLFLQFGDGLGGDPTPALLHVDVHDGGRGHIHLDLRYHLTVIGDDRPCPPAGESQAVRWYRWDEAIAIADPGLGGLLRATQPSR
jgi:8-oxo-dGTP pyrophosphatase MutT (NUDIX family)